MYSVQRMLKLLTSAIHVSFPILIVLNALQLLFFAWGNKLVYADIQSPNTHILLLNPSFSI